MDVLFNVLELCGFTRSSIRVGNPVVILAVPGAGKTTFLRRLLLEDTRFVGCTFGIPDPHGVTGRHILDARTLGPVEEGKLVLVDEFQRGDYKALNPYAILGDVAQFCLAPNLVIEANWFKSSSHRVPSVVCDLLNTLGFSITGSSVGELHILGLFESDLRGTVITYEPEICQLLTDHACEHTSLEACAGVEFEEVSLLLNGPVIPASDRAKFYLAATRASKVLNIFLPIISELSIAGHASDSTT